MIAGIFLVAGFALAFRSAVRGIGVLVGFVAVTSSLAWQSGLSNLALPGSYILGFLLGTTVDYAVSRRRREPGPGEGRLARLPTLRRAALVAIGALTAAWLLAFARIYLADPSRLTIALRAAGSSLSTFGPPEMAGQLHGFLIAASGPLLFLVCIASLGTRKHQESALKALQVGMLVAVLSPAAQYALGWEPAARPDLGIREAVDGWVGFFQDPHSYAAYLVLALGTSLGSASGAMRTGRRFPAACNSLLVLVILTVLLATDSRSGLISAAVTIFFFIALMRGIVGSPKNAMRTPELVVLTTTLIICAVVLSSSAVRSGLGHWLERAGASRTSQLLRLDDEALARIRMESIEPRLFAWQRAGLMFKERPIWGAGPGGFARSEITPPGFETNPNLSDPRLHSNAHNYYLQVLTEFGVVALLAFLWLVSASLRIIARAASVCSAPSRQSLLAGIAAAQGGFLMFCVVSHPLLLAELQASYWVLTGLGVSLAQLSVEEEERGGS